MLVKKNKSTCLVESSLKFDACFHFEFSTSIVAFEAQPLGYEYEFDNRICPYTPDFLLTHTDGTQKFIEVKPQSKIADEDFRARFIEKQSIAKQGGRDLILVTDLAL
ncbi:Tn7 transposase TnsA N-terminal domain-containing protein [Pseudoalteromonas carrageenovora]|uniref:Tn7 transposase TnsA N-terminal domain-containing protein n=1 Tax=Pseudoalteromonas carrageenovora TaxID=227 RepID=UPI0026E1FA04|nr:Tn7 transposase TnsA N-terminal domain-containing protein [Pseudoalteromonas carrageenovora]MDO6547629.1 Tn7 transposase TnsA N-terminal domain-containing protein [Pseudoalteromonas carrageenovora]MDO6832094.1 Tn7 transposase TnsA N-terminal domain-containing protein [Pseudoalteromonas carrageenovora]